MSQVSYKYSQSLLYEIHPMVKGCIALFVILFFSLNDLTVYISAAAISLILIVVSLFKVPLRDIFMSTRKILFLIIFVGLLRGFEKDGFNIFTALDAALRILGVFFTAGIFVTVTSQSELMYFWEKVFSPLKLLRLPSRELALVMVIAVKFFPVIMSEIDRIKMAQTARGANLSNRRNVIAKAAEVMPLIIPTLAQAIIRASELAEAMEARGYRASENRTNYYLYNIKLIDLIFFIPAFALLIVAILF